MVKHWKYLKYVLRHKWYVMLACFREGLYWRSLVHDLSKFLPSEWFPYAEHFYGSKRKPWRDSTGYYKPTNSGDLQFDYAWLYHQNRNAHHWQYWVLTEDDTGKPICMPMPPKYIAEMVCDWRGAGKAQGFGSDPKQWYMKNRKNMQLHQQTRLIIERMLNICVCELEEGG